ncbi:hypothetical protein BDK51DRAFT_26220 [Blyttiomyces helicus]|uniref:Major facilitator superfamily (MFS) profile domain-containing protein n=1 Tax=Blyttiomyces helicus TaxID=388810 RepID=A0A4P9W3K7_9FUNG|nr:hypothetical protein BDK51DRAFT_26220 [Blyttiomyces helicus]|eukprot:RKO84726.1 hypothetical protein BDK51DRAFT_26220 [Blyttiomyces helicus]
MNGFGLLYGILEYNHTANGSTNFSGLIPTADNDNETSWVTSAFLLGCVGGAVWSSLLLNFQISFLAVILGRKRCIILGSLVFNAGIAMQVSADGFGLFYSGRVTSGWAIGFLSMVVSLFISETAPTTIRGRMVAIQQLMITLGILLASIANTIIIDNIDNNSSKEWRVALGLQGVPGVVLFFITFLLPMSPRWLAMKGCDAEAIAILFQLLSQEVSSPRHHPRCHRPQAGDRQRLLERDGDAWDRQSRGIYLIERIGRRKLLILGGIGMAVSHYMIVLLLNLSRSHGHGFAWAAICFVFTFEFCLASTWGPAVWVYQSEMFPLRIRSKGTGFGTISNWTNNFFITKYNPHISTSWEFYQYILYGTMCTFGTIFTYFFIPKTMGLSLEAMDELFAANKSNFKHREIAVEHDVEFSVVDKKN